MPYNHTSIEQKWQKFWEREGTFSTKNPDISQKNDTQDSSAKAESNQTFYTENGGPKPKKYILDMFPYPSGAGLHVGHPKGYTATDIVSRFYHAKGYNVLHPMGFDAFGLPAENYAIKTGTHPAITTAENIETFISQLKNLGFSYDWNRMVDTTDPGYYKWTQWIFLELFKRGLAYEQDLPINYCPSCKTGLANEEVLSDNTCDRCGTRVERRPIRQWVLRITEYAERLISDLDGLDWPEGIKEMQRNWIGKSEGCEFEMRRDNKKMKTTSLRERRGPQWSAKSSSDTSIFKDIIKVKKKNEILRSIDTTIHHGDKKIICNSDNIFKHFSGKSTIEFYRRKNLLSTIYPLLEEIVFENNIGYCIIDTIVVKVILGQQSNGNYFIKTYYVDDRKTEEHRKYIMESTKETPFIRVYTTRVDTVFGMTYAVLAPDHPKVSEFITDEQRAECEKYIESAKSKSDQDRTADNKEKTGVFTGSYVINPYNSESVPLWIADYVLGHYGTGAVMAVPAHDERDGEFARKYNLPIKQTIGQKFGNEANNSTRRDRVGAIIMNDDFILCEKLNTKDTKFNGEYLLVGGGIEEGESPEEALKREILEELNITDFEIIQEVGVYSTSWFSHPKKENRSMFHHIFSIRLDPTKISENTDQAELEWVKIDTLLTDFDQNNKQDQADAIRRILNKAIFSDDGILVNSGEHDGLSSADARKILTEKAETEGFGIKKVNYKLRDWLFSRQRYWGEPIPLIHISHEDYAKLPRFENTKKSGDSYSHEGEGVTHNGDTAKFPLSLESIVKTVKKVKKKSKKIPLSSVYTKCDTAKGVIIFNGNHISRHFGSKDRKERDFRSVFGFTIGSYLDDLIYTSDTVGYIVIRDYLFKVVLKEISPKNYIVKTYYPTKNKYSGLLEGSYSASILTQSDSEYLMIGEKEFSKIYSGINGKIVIDHRLPLTLPEVERYEPAGDGQSPLATVPSFVNVKLAENLSGKRETNTMPQWGGSCWYYLRYMDNKNSDALAGKEALDYWGIVDEYVGGAEHAVLHLLYARFWHKVLYDAGIVPTKEPFQKLINQGMILAYAYERQDGGLVAVDLVEERDGKFFERETGKEVKQVVAKMSKSLKNVINPNDIVREYGADTLRLYEMNMAGFTDTAPWNPEAITGVRRFLDKAYSAFMAEVKSEKGKVKSSETDPADMKKMKLLHKTIKKVGEDIIGYKFNTAISSLMILLNEGIPTDTEFAHEWKEAFTVLLHPFAPHMAEELWSLIVSRHSDEGRIQEASGTLDASQTQHDGSSRGSIYNAPWPEYDEFMLVDDEVTIAVQVNGKLRGTLNCFNGVAQEEVSALAHTHPDIAKWLEGKTLLKEIFIPNKMLSIVVKD